MNYARKKLGILQRVKIKRGLIIIPLLAVLLSSTMLLDLQAQTLIATADRGEKITKERELIKSDSDINSQNSYGHTALFEAASEGKTEVLKLLIKAGADTEIQAFYDGRTALINWAYHKGKSEIGRILIRGGANIDFQIKKYDGETALIAAVNNVQALKILIAAGASLDLQNKRGESALMKAAVYGSTDALKALIKAGANVDLSDESGSTALIIAATKGNVVEVELLLKAGANVNERNSYGKNALFRAYNAETVQTLLQAGCDFTTLKRNEITPLDHAISRRKKDIVQLLIKAGANPHLASLFESSFKGGKWLVDLVGEQSIDMKSQNGDTALIRLFHEENTFKAVNFKAIKFLINSGASLDLQNNQGKTALMYTGSAKYGEKDRDCEGIKILLEAGANIHIRDLDGYTALTHAVEQGQLQATETLIKAGADVNSKNNRDETLLFTALVGKTEALQGERLYSWVVDAKRRLIRTQKHKATPLQVKMYDLLIKKLTAAGSRLTDIEELQVATDECLSPRSIGNKSEIALKCSGIGAHLDMQDKKGYTALMYAVENDDPQTARLLIDAGVNVNTRDYHYHTTAFHRASTHGIHVELLRLLERQGADINAKNKKGFTPLMAAISSLHFVSNKNNDSRTKIEEIVKTILNLGADVDMKDEHGQTALTLARKSENTYIINLLTKAGSKDQKSALLARHIRPNTMRALIKAGLDINQQNVTGETALMLAVKTGKAERVNILIDAGANPDLQDKKGRTPLRYAAQRNFGDIVTLLLKAGANPDIQDKSGFTALMKASLEPAASLINAGANVNLTTDSGESALYIQAASSKPDLFFMEQKAKLVEKLITAGANNIDYVNRHGTTALMRSVQNGYPQVAKVLIRAGANINRLDYSGYSVVDRAFMKKHEAILSLLSPFSQKAKTALYHTAVVSDDEKKRRRQKTAVFTEDQNLGKKVLITIAMGDSSAWDVSKYQTQEFFMSRSIFPTIHKRHKISGYVNEQLTVQEFLDMLEQYTRGMDMVVLVYEGHGIDNTALPAAISLSRSSYCPESLFHSYEAAGDEFDTLLRQVNNSEITHTPEVAARLKELEASQDKQEAYLTSKLCYSVDRLVPYKAIAKVLKGKQVLFINSSCFSGIADQEMRRPLAGNFVLLASAQPNELSWSFFNSLDINKSSSVFTPTASLISPLFSEIYKRLYSPQSSSLDRDNDYYVTVDELLTDFPTVMDEDLLAKNKSIIAAHPNRIVYDQGWLTYIQDNATTSSRADMHSETYIQLPSRQSSNLPKLIVREL